MWTCLPPGTVRCVFFIHVCTCLAFTLTPFEAKNENDQLSWKRNEAETEMSHVCLSEIQREMTDRNKWWILSAAMKQSGRCWYCKWVFHVARAHTQTQVILLIVANYCVGVCRLGLVGVLLAPYHFDTVADFVGTQSDTKFPTLNLQWKSQS